MYSQNKNQVVAPAKTASFTLSSSEHGAQIPIDTDTAASNTITVTLPTITGGTDYSYTDLINISSAAGILIFTTTGSNILDNVTGSLSSSLTINPWQVTDQCSIFISGTKWVINRSESVKANNQSVVSAITANTTLLVANYPGGTFVPVTIGTSAVALTLDSQANYANYSTRDDPCWSVTLYATQNSGTDGKLVLPANLKGSISCNGGTALYVPGSSTIDITLKTGDTLLLGADQTNFYVSGAIAGVAANST